jgi:hypothetical protein
MNSMICQYDNIHILDLENSRVELNNGFSFQVPIPDGDIEDILELLTSLAKKKGIIGKNDIIICFCH